MDFNARKPNDVRGFVHKRIARGIRGVARGFLRGGPLGAITGGAAGFFGGPPDAGCPPGFRVDANGECAPVPSARQLRAFAPTLGFGPSVSPGGTPFSGTCPPGHHQERQPNGDMPCVPDRFGEAVMGQFGAALQPEVFQATTRRCPRGSVLGVDGLCYNRRDIRNNERAWPRGRRPLLTGGEMRCISVASAAAKKLQKKQKQLEELGMLKKPARRAPQKLLAAGHHAHVSHD